VRVVEHTERGGLSFVAANHLSGQLCLAKPTTLNEVEV
jgi:hypothetical protein